MQRSTSHLWSIASQYRLCGFDRCEHLAPGEGLMKTAQRHISSVWSRAVAGDEQRGDANLTKRSGYIEATSVVRQFDVDECELGVPSLSVLDCRWQIICNGDHIVSLLVQKTRHLKRNELCVFDNENAHGVLSMRQTSEARSIN